MQNNLLRYKKKNNFIFYCELKGNADFLYNGFYSGTYES